MCLHAGVRHTVESSIFSSLFSLACGIPSPCPCRPSPGLGPDRSPALPPLLFASPAESERVFKVTEPCRVHGCCAPCVQARAKWLRHRKSNALCPVCRHGRQGGKLGCVACKMQGAPTRLRGRSESSSAKDAHSPTRLRGRSESSSAKDAHSPTRLRGRSESSSAKDAHTPTRLQAASPGPCKLRPRARSGGTVVRLGPLG
jgi:hypothetical protein